MRPQGRSATTNLTGRSVAELCVLAWRKAMATWVARYHFFEQLRSITAYIVFADWRGLLETIADPKARPP